MKYSREDSGSETTLHIGGALDAMTAPELRPTIDDIVAKQTKRVVVDLSELDLIDSSGVAAVVSLFKRVRSAGGEVRIIGVRDQPLAIFKLLRMDRVFEL